MQLVVTASGVVVAWHVTGQEVSGGYPGCVVLPVPDGTPVEVGQTWNVDLGTARAAVCEAIDTAAERLRQTVLTPGAGQMAAYQAKEGQARALLVDPAPTEGDYPDIFNEIGITAASAGEVAMAVLAAAEKWRTYGRAVERVRLSAKKAVAETSDLAGLLAAREAVDWPQC
jgi:hypothetical protein